MTPLAAIEAEDKGSSKPILAEEKGNGPAKIEEDKKGRRHTTRILDEGPFDQVLGGRRYRVHHAAGKVMGRTFGIPFGVHDFWVRAR
jgi:hypothetical protein